MQKGKGRSILSLIMIMLLILTSLVACTTKIPELVSASQDTSSELENKTIILSTTTSTENSGLLDFLLPLFTEDTGIEVKVVAVGTGQALKMGEDGEADVLLVHAKSAEEEFVKAGHGLERFEVMYNDFVLLGPEDDTLNLAENAKADILKGFSLIQENEVTFVSRGDDSGTHKMELSLWKELGIAPSGSWYIEAGQGMGAVIQMANEMLGYTLADRATYLSMMDKVDLKVVIEGDNKLFNQYGIIAVNPNKNDKINGPGAEQFINWMLSEKGQNLIAEFGKDTFGQSLFIPNAK